MGADQHMILKSSLDSQSWGTLVVYHCAHLSALIYLVLWDKESSVWCLLIVLIISPLPLHLCPTYRKADKKAQVFFLQVLVRESSHVSSTKQYSQVGTNPLKIINPQVSQFALPLTEKIMFPPLHSEASQREQHL